MTTEAWHQEPLRFISVTTQAWHRDHWDFFLRLLRLDVMTTEVWCPTTEAYCYHWGFSLLLLKLDIMTTEAWHCYHLVLVAVATKVWYPVRWGLTSGTLRFDTEGLTPLPLRLAVPQVFFCYNWGLTSWRCLSQVMLEPIAHRGLTRMESTGITIIPVSQVRVEVRSQQLIIPVILELFRS